MSDKEYDPFAPSTGLPDDFNGEIKEAWFAYDPEYQDGQIPMLHMTLITDDDDFNAQDKPLKFACGKGWVIEGRGETVSREDGTTKGFHEGTAYQLFIMSALECAGAENVLRSESRGDPRKAAMWNGLSWHFKRTEHDYGGEIGKIARLMPKLFLGEKGIGSVEAQAVVNSAATPSKVPVKATGPVKASGPTKAAGPVKKAAPQAQAAATATWGEQHPLWETLWAVAWDADSHESFVEAAFTTIAGVQGDGVVEQGVMDNGPESMWAKVVAAYEAQNQ